MQLVRFQYANSRISWGVRIDERLYDLGSAGSFRSEAFHSEDMATPRLAEDLSLMWALANWGKAKERVETLLPTLTRVDEPHRALCPVPAGSKVICIGLNYRDHAIESGMEIPSEPVVFNKWAGALCGPADPIVLPKISESVDYEAELVLVVGKPARHVDEAAAAESIFGYSCGHDVSARDWQLGRPGGQWLLGKSFPNFAPVGPWIVPREELHNVDDCPISLRINGETLQASSTAQLIFKPAQLISYLSQFCRLEPGDVVFTGTPPGVGMARNPRRFLKPGDVCEVEIDRIGTLRNVCEAEPSSI